MSLARQNITTADSFNRLRDKRRVETLQGLPEHHPSASEGAPIVLFSAHHDGDLILAHSYTRVVFGDHGAYVELAREQINWSAFPLRNEAKEQVEERFYDEFFTADKSVMLYGQRKRVGSRPPNDGQGTVVKTIQRECYADYVPGMFYLSVKDVKRKDSSAASHMPQPVAGAAMSKAKKKSRLQ